MRQKSPFFILLICVMLPAVAYSQDKYLHFEDIKFEQALLSHNPVIDTDNDGRISEKEATSFAGELNIENRGVSAVEEIACFKNITKLSCAYNKLQYIPFGIHPRLAVVNCDYNRLIDLDVTELTALTRLSCVSNRLTFLSLIRNLKISDIACRLTLIAEVYINRKTNHIALKIQKEAGTRIVVIDEKKNPHGDYPQREYDTF